MPHHMRFSAQSTALLIIVSEKKANKHLQQYQRVLPTFWSINFLKTKIWMLLNVTPKQAPAPTHTLLLTEPATCFHAREILNQALKYCLISFSPPILRKKQLKKSRALLVRKSLCIKMCPTGRCFLIACAPCMNTTPFESILQAR
ncbi:hypothetical protein SDC9_130259 [bioreactor metagenome]|uniref:Uncharacterized protein n=1 Tax=bioreactor metagenome TaxID=1076179 RepID=A0A645D1A1_9ZZZZ